MAPSRSIGRLFAKVILSTAGLVLPVAAHAEPDDGPASSSSSRSEGSEAAPRSGTADDGRSNSGGLFGPLRIGAFGGVGLPRPVSIEGMVKIDDVVGIGLEYSTLPKVSASGVGVTLNAIAADLRVFPLRNGFFIGLSAGRQQFVGTASLTLPLALGSVAEEISATTWFVTPRIGFLWTLSWGLTIGIDAGAQIPVAANFTNTIPSALSVSQAAGDVSHLFGKDVLPSIDVLRLGFLF